jgi:hypothetical protein
MHSLCREQLLLERFAEYVMNDPQLICASRSIGRGTGEVTRLEGSPQPSGRKSTRNGMCGSEIMKMGIVCYGVEVDDRQILDLDSEWDSSWCV